MLRLGDGELTRSRSGTMLLGAFSRFRRAVDRADLGIARRCFADDRRWGRARQELADLGLRPA